MRATIAQAEREKQMAVLLTAVLGLIGLLAVLMLWVVFGGDSQPRRKVPAVTPELKTDSAPSAAKDSPAS
ncbi:MAG: hypothetical protein AAFY19_12580, partial [Pseudomonadota bacterium]